jgi:tetratricopeptide (TPR) repeat protein
VSLEIASALITMLLFVGLNWRANADDATNNPTAVTNTAARIRSTFAEADARHKKEPASAEAAWQFARACFDLADIAGSNSERAAIAEQGIAACQQVIARQAGSAAAHYYLGMNLGQLAQTRGLGALKLVKQMEGEFTIAKDLDEHFDYAGPDRNLGLLYLGAPVLASIGSRSKARQHLKRAVELAPEYPENRLNLIEAYSKWGDRHDATRELKALEEGWDAARVQFAGEQWFSSWVDWEERLKKVKKKVEEPSKALEAPHKQ